MGEAFPIGKLLCTYPNAGHAPRRGRMELGISLTLSDPPDAQPLQGSKGQQQFSNRGYSPLPTHAEGNHEDQRVPAHDPDTWLHGIWVSAFRQTH
jgi:hypothetical protein